MKSLMLALMMAASFGTQASTIDTYALPLTGLQAEENFTMNAVQTRTEYRSETVTRTCWRTVQDGYRNICRQEPQTVCYEDHMSRMNCTTRFITQCYNEVQFRQEAYPCHQTVSVPYEVFNNNVKANVSVKVSSAPSDVQVANTNCTLDFTLDGNNFKSVARCPLFIVLADKTADETSEGNTVIQNRTLDLTLLDAKKLSAPTQKGIKEMRLEGQTLVFRTGDLTKNPNFSLKLFVERRRLLKSDETLIKRNLAPSEYSFEKTSEDSGLVRINLEKLIGGINAKKKHVLKVDLNVELDTTKSINATLPPLSASESITVNR